MRLVDEEHAPPATGWEALLEEQLALLDREGLVRTLRPVERGPDAVVVRDGRRLLNLSSNDYLGLSRHPQLAAAAAEATARGTGSTASRLIVGDDPRYEALEQAVAAFQGTEAALVIGSGYLANVGVLAALLGRDDVVFSDRLNHASVWDGIRLSGARLHRYRHGDADQLEAMLKRAGRRPGTRKLIVTESVFGMDGDVAPLRDIVEVKERYGAALMLDEAHAGGVFGPGGEGMAHELGVADRVDLHLGTFSKAFGVYGAYVAGSETWIRFLTTSCRSFIYSTALPPPVVAAIAAAVDVVRASHGQRRALRENAERVRAGLARQGFDTGASMTQIVPVVVGESDAALALGRALEARGVLAVPIRPPTVPRGTARLRLSVTSEHSGADLERALGALEEAGRELGIVGRA